MLRRKINYKNIFIILSFKLLHTNDICDNRSMPWRSLFSRNHNARALTEMSARFGTLNSLSAIHEEYNVIFITEEGMSSKSAWFAFDWCENYGLLIKFEVLTTLDNLIPFTIIAKNCFWLEEGKVDRGEPSDHVIMFWLKSEIVNNFGTQKNPRRLQFECEQEMRYFLQTVTE